MQVWGKKLFHGLSCCFVEDRKGLSRPVPVWRGIRDGRLLSGMPYAPAIEPSLNQRVHGVDFATDANISVIFSAYVDDLTVFITNWNDIHILQKSYQCMRMHRLQVLTGKRVEKQVGAITSSCAAMEQREWWNALELFLTVTISNNSKNWESIVEKISAQLCGWTFIQSQMSCLGRSVVINNLAASELWIKWFLSLHIHWCGK